MAATPARGRFRPIVELRSGRVHSIVVEPRAAGGPLAALETLAGWRRAWPVTRDAAIAIDVEAHELSRLSASDLADALARYGLAPESLVLRIGRFGAGHESSLLDAIAELGVAIAIAELDLRGADSGLLAGAPIDVVELPAAAVATVDRGPPAVVLRQLLALAHRHDWLTVARGVTREGQVAALDRLGCDLHAGPLVSDDLDEATVDRWLAGR